MFKKALFPLVMLCALHTFSQTKTCDTPDEDNLLLDLNSITKCSIKDSKNTTDDPTKNKKVAVVVSSRRRVIRKRSTASGINNTAYSHKIKKIKNTNTIAKSLDISTNNKIVPFDFVDKIPLFKKCKNSPIYQQEKCFKKELSNHIRKNLKYPEYAYESAIQGKVIVYFTINKDGNVGKMNITAPYKGEVLADEAKRIMKKLPAFIPGKHNGNNVTVKYGFPILFKIPGVKPSNIRKASKKVNLKEVYKFNELETIPQFASCNKTNDKSLKCYNANLVKHIQENFAYPKTAVDDGIQGIVNVAFVINKSGKIINIETKGPVNGRILERAAKVLIEKLPKFRAGTKDGKSVNVKYAFPVTFKLD